MSEYQYYEFVAVDQALDAKARDALRAISSRAKITATSFVNHYEYGDLKADPIALMGSYFDLFVYVANWGTRRFAIRLPKSALNEADIQRFSIDDEVMTVKSFGNYLILDMEYNEEEPSGEWEEGEQWLAALSPLRKSLIEGDQSLFFLLWLVQVERGWIREDAIEPLPGVAMISEPLRTLADFLKLDRHLLEAAIQSQPSDSGKATAKDIDGFLRSLPENEKLNLLAHLYVGDDPHLSAGLRRRHRETQVASAQMGHRTAGELKKLAEDTKAESKRRAAEKAAADRQRREAEKAQARKKHLAALAQRGEVVWKEIENEVQLRTAQGYDKAASLLADLAEIATNSGTGNIFLRRIAETRDRHSQKRKFIERVDALFSQEKEGIEPRKIKS